MENNMTNIERKLMQEEKSFSSLKRLAERTHKIIEDHITERIEDHYFADSWEESSQISRDIERLEEKVLFLERMEKSFLLHVKPCVEELSRLKRIVLHPVW